MKNFKNYFDLKFSNFDNTIFVADLQSSQFERLSLNSTHLNMAYQLICALPIPKDVVDRILMPYLLPEFDKKTFAQCMKIIQCHIDRCENDNCQTLGVRKIGNPSFGSSFNRLVTLHPGDPLEWDLSVFCKKGCNKSAVISQEDIFGKKFAECTAMLRNRAIFYRKYTSVVRGTIVKELVVVVPNTHANS